MLPFADDIYLIEIRLARTKWRIKELTSSLAHANHIVDSMEQHPHVTLFGPFSLKEGTSEKDLLSVIGNIACRYDPVPFILNGWEKREGMHGSVIAFSVQPSDELKTLTAAIADVVQSRVNSMNVWDSQPEKKWFHVTIANRLDSATCASTFSEMDGSAAAKREKSSETGVFFAIKDFFKKSPPITHSVFHPPLLDETGLRITVMRGERIFSEYDFSEHRWVMTGLDHPSLSWQQTLLAYRHHAGFEMCDPAPAHPEDNFVISDLHLGHTNIIRYCSRPFIASDTREMDHVLIKNWNYTVSPKDRIFHLGDLRYGKDALLLHEYRKKLRGQISFIAGNHDEDDLSAIDRIEISADGRKFLLIHDPADAPPGFDGWIIHGHYHNNDLRNFPFINFSSRRINASTEVIGYRPVSLHELCGLISQKEARNDTKPILLRYSHVIPDQGTPDTDFLHGNGEIKS